MNTNKNPDMQSTVDELALNLIKRGTARARELISQAFGDIAPMNGASREVHHEPRNGATKTIKRVDSNTLKPKILAHVEQNPGQRAEEIMPHVRPSNVKPTAIMRVLRLLADDKQLRTRGVARGTKYFPMTAKTVTKAATKTPKRDVKRPAKKAGKK